MNEELRYTFAYQEMTQWVQMEVVCVATALIIGLVGSGESAFAPVATLVFALLGVLCGVLALAIYSDGYCRQAVESLTGDMDNPPISDWQEDLRQRGEKV